MNLTDEEKFKKLRISLEKRESNNFDNLVNVISIN